MGYDASFTGIGEMLRADFMEADMVKRAFQVLSRAEATAPFYAQDRDGAHYRDAFHVESGRRGGARHDRAFASVVNTDSAALFVEYGSKNNPAHRTLGKALDAAGDFITLQRAGRLLGDISTAEIRALVRRGQLGSIRTGRQTHVSRADVLRLRRTWLGAGG